MKILIILALFILSFQAYGQQLERTSDENGCSYYANEVQYDMGTKEYNLRGQVNIECEDLKVYNATHVIYNSEQKSITAHRFEEYSFKGTVESESLRDFDPDKTVLTYTLGANRLYISMDKQR